MSIEEITEIECPKCGTKVKTTIWSSLNVSVDPEAKKDLWEGKINLFQCTICDFEDFVPVPLLYHDMENEFWVQYYPFESLEDDNFFDSFLSHHEKLNMVMGNIPERSLPVYMKSVHIVFSMEELVRYAIFRDKLAEFKKQNGR